MDRTSSSSHDKENDSEKVGGVADEAAVVGPGYYPSVDVVTHATTTTNLKEERPETYYVERYGARVGPLLGKLFASGVEARGVERVPEDQRTMKNAWNKCVLGGVVVVSFFCSALLIACFLFLLFPCAFSLLMWWCVCDCKSDSRLSDVSDDASRYRSVNCVLTTIPIGVLAQEFYTLTLPSVLSLFHSRTLTAIL